MKNLIIFGSEEIAELAHYYFTNDSDYKILAFTVDDDYVNKDNVLGTPLIPFSQVKEKYPPGEVEMHVALSYMKLNQLRQAKFEQAKEAGYTLASYVCSKSVTWPDLSIGENCFILENQTIQPTVKIGNNVMIWSGNHLGHGSIFGAHTYISSHVVVSGHCNIGERCFFGVNATVRDFCSIGNDCFITMDGSVIKDVSDGSVVLGAKGDIIDGSNPKATAIIKRYFKL